ncbi:MAG: hypothetical protein H6707_21680 [Deltaproteobacteria bacterium]|nr:hypothetical protein [Deltaproteobacteria bacterium]
MANDLRLASDGRLSDGALNGDGVTPALDAPNFNDARPSDAAGPTSCQPGSNLLALSLVGPSVTATCHSNYSVGAFFACLPNANNPLGRLTASSVDPQLIWSGFASKHKRAPLRCAHCVASKPTATL